MCDIPAYPGGLAARWCKCEREHFEACQAEREKLYDTIRYALDRGRPNMKQLHAVVSILNRGKLTFYDSENDGSKGQFQVVQPETGAADSSALRW